MHQRSITANGLDQHVLEWPCDTQPARGTVLLLHGYMDAAGTWDLVAPALAVAGFGVLALDMRGFGEGARVGAGGYYHFTDYVFDVADVVDQVSPHEPVAIVGHSMGGTVATLFSGAFPERVSHLACLEGLGPPDQGFAVGPSRVRHWVEQVRAVRNRPSLPTMTRDEALARLAANHPAVAPEVLAHRLPHLVRDAGGGRVRWRFDPLHRTTSPVPFFAGLLSEFAKKIACPVLFVSGGHTGWHPPDEDERLASFSNLTRAEIEGAGHMMHWTRPEALVAILASFLA